MSADRAVPPALRRIEPIGSGRAWPARLADAAKVSAAIVLGAGAALAIAAVLAAALGVVGVPSGFSTVRSNLDTSSPRVATTTWGGCAAIVVFATGGWLAARVACVGTLGRGALIGLGAGVVATALAVALAYATLRPAADFRSAAIELGAVAVAETDPAADGDLGVPAIDYDHRFIRASAQAATYLIVVVLLLLGAAALGGVVGATGRARLTRGARPGS